MESDLIEGRTLNYMLEEKRPLESNSGTSQKLKIDRGMKIQYNNMFNQDNQRNDETQRDKKRKHHREIICWKLRYSWYKC